MGIYCDFRLITSYYEVRLVFVNWSVQVIQSVRHSNALENFDIFQISHTWNEKKFNIEIKQL